MLLVERCVVAIGGIFVLFVSSASLFEWLLSVIASTSYLLRVSI